MPYYLSSYIGSGQERDPCRPRGFDQPGWAAIDLRADGGASPAGNGLNACLLYLPEHDPDPKLFQFADVKGETLPPVVRAGIAARLNATLNFPRFDDLVADLLVRPPGNGWKALLARTREIYLGGLLSPRPAIYPVASSQYKESWTHANIASALTADLTWTLQNGTAWGITSNEAKFSGAVLTQRAYPNVDVETDDNVATLFLSTRGANGFVGVAARMSTTNIDNYHVFAGVGTGGNHWLVEKRVVNVTTQLAAVATTPAAGDTMQISAVGSTITGRFNSTDVGPTTDTAVTTGTKTMLDGYIDIAGSFFSVDNLTFRDNVAQCRPEVLIYPANMGVM